MRGKPSVFVRAGKLEATRALGSTPCRIRYDFSAFADHELEALVALAEKVEAAGGEPAWTDADLVVLNRLEGKLQAATGDRR